MDQENAVEEAAVEETAVGTAPFQETVAEKAPVEETAAEKAAVEETAAEFHIVLAADRMDPSAELVVDLLGAKERTGFLRFDFVELRSIRETDAGLFASIDGTFDRDHSLGSSIPREHPCRLLSGDRLYQI